MLKCFNKIFFTLLIFNSVFVIAQTNLVPNPSFEIYDTCPTQQLQIRYATGWNAYRNTVLYFNSCASLASSVSVPSNAGGYQYAASGNAYIGVYSYFSDLLQDIGAANCQLTTPLVKGLKYYVSFKVSLDEIDSANEANTATDHLGALFYITPTTYTFPSLPVNNFAHVFGHTIITDTLNWTQVFGSFIADSAYKYLAIGNFFDKAHTNKTYFFSYNEPDTAAFYFIDDVCVSTDSLYTTNYSWTGIKENNFNQNRIVFYPNPSLNGIFYANTVFLNEQIEVFDVLGKSLKKLSINGNTIDLSYLENGIYIIEFSDKKYKTKQKIIINNY